MNSACGNLAREVEMEKNECFLLSLSLVFFAVKMVFLIFKKYYMILKA